MQSTIHNLPVQPSPRPASETDARSLYFHLLEPCRSAQHQQAAGAFLDQQLQAARRLPCDLPEDPRALDAWLEQRVEAVGARFQAYLAERKAGAPRRYFPGKAQALHFLRGVAPTKLVDGAWLYGLLPHWQDARFRALIQTYLEELGEGSPALNHVLLYRQLLASHGCEQWQRLEPAHFVQGAIQLALAECTADHLPEVIGFNLGYEQLPLHLLITAHELAELDIDPHYFTLHVTVDNAHSGHASQALQALRDAWPRLADSDRFYRRVRDGYRLNDLGKGTLGVIGDFDAEREALRVLQEKSAAGKLMHAGGCRFDGRTVNQWLGEPEQMPAFVAELKRRGWIRLNEDPARSRFWRLIEGERAPMFGVFTPYEQEVIRAWIAGDRYAEGFAARRPRRLPTQQAAATQDTPPASGDDFDEELRLLRQEVARLPNQTARMQRLIGLLSPIHHHSAAGLLATRLFCQSFKATATHG